jgi:hypothetical protein
MQVRGQAPAIRMPGHSIGIAKPPFHYRWKVGCQPNLVGVVPFVPLFLSSVQRIRAPVVEGNPRNSSSKRELVLIAIMSERAWPERAEVNFSNCKFRTASAFLLWAASSPSSRP